jgi:hypothetical protein
MLVLSLVLIGLAITLGRTPLAAPVIAGTRLRGGNAASARGAASFATASVATARAAGCSGLLVARAGFSSRCQADCHTCSDSQDWPDS